MENVYASCGIHKKIVKIEGYSKTEIDVYIKQVDNVFYSAIFGLIPRHKLVCTLAAAQVRQRLQRFGIRVVQKLRLGREP
jgi:hypothetical protein